MEWQFCINWSALIEEAKQRRKQLKLTQQRLAMLAGVSTPTISRFENGEKDVQLSSVLNILGMLGMVDKRQLVFLQPNASYNPALQQVIFSAVDNENKPIFCAISKEALDDYFKSTIKDPLKIFADHIGRIEHEARRKYLRGQFEPDGSILIRTGDFI